MAKRNENYSKHYTEVGAKITKIQTKVNKNAHKGQSARLIKSHLTIRQIAIKRQLSKEFQALLWNHKRAGTKVRSIYLSYLVPTCLLILLRFCSTLL